MSKVFLPGADGVSLWVGIMFLGANLSTRPFVFVLLTLLIICVSLSAPLVVIADDTADFCRHTY